MNTVDILDFGAAPNTGRILTKEIQAALDAASARSGATVIIPAGEFVTGTLNLGCASLYLEKGAVLKGSPNIEDYVFNGYEHNEMGKTLSLLYSLHHGDIRIAGEGTIDLNGDSFYHLDRPSVPDSTVPFTEKQRGECTRLYDRRPNQPIFFYDCQRVRIQDIRIVNAPCWTMSFVECEDIRIAGLTIDNSLVLPNNDGMHFCSCRKVFVRDCNISSGDDCIALSAITDWEKPCEDVVISDCILRSCSKAIVIGYMHSIVRNVCVSNCIVKESNRAFCVMTSSGTGARGKHSGEQPAARHARPRGELVGEW
jgi:polygalacturonase